MKFSIIVVCSDNIDHNTRCVSAIAALGMKDFEVLVANRGTACPPLPGDRFRLIPLGEDVSDAAAKNLAAQQAQTDWLFFIDTNVYLEPECLSVLNSAAIRHENMSVFSITMLDDAVPAILNSTGTHYFFAGFSWQGGQGWEVETLPDEGVVWGASAGALLVRRDVFARLHGFDEAFKGAGYETDLAFRLRLGGYKTIQVVEAFARIDPRIHVYESTRNSVLAFMKNMPDLYLWPLLPLHAGMQLLRLLDIENFKPRWNGLDDAMKDVPAIWKKRIANVTLIAHGLTYNPWKWLWRRTDIHSG